MPGGGKKKKSKERQVESSLPRKKKEFGFESCILRTYIRTYRRSTFQSIEFVKLALCLDR